MPDLRLAIPALALWVTCAVLIGVPAVAAGVAAIAAASAIGTVGLAVLSAIGDGSARPVRVRRLRLLPLVATVLGALALGSAVVAVQAPGRVDAGLDRAASESGTVQETIRVERTPHRTAAGFGSMPRWTLRGRTSETRRASRCPRFDAAVKTARTFAIGTVVRATGSALLADPGEATSYTIRMSGEDAPTIEDPPPAWLAWAAAARTTFAEAAAGSPGVGGRAASGAGDRRRDLDVARARPGDDRIVPQPPHGRLGSQLRPGHRPDVPPGAVGRTGTPHARRGGRRRTAGVRRTRRAGAERDPGRRDGRCSVDRVGARAACRGHPGPVAGDGHPARPRPVACSRLRLRAVHPRDGRSSGSGGATQSPAVAMDAAVARAGRRRADRGAAGLPAGPDPADTDAAAVRCPGQSARRAGGSRRHGVGLPGLRRSAGRRRSAS